MATTSEAAAHVFLTTSRFHELVAQGVISKVEGRSAYDLNTVREEYIRNLRAKFHGQGKGNIDGLSQARANLAREQAEAVALKNATARGENVPLATVKRGVEILFSAFRERILAIPGKIADGCAMRPREEIEDIVRDELHEALDELSRPILPVDGGDGGEGCDNEADDE
jgi:phage terminase Nu1 subunit (DNA packaging protein)